MAYNVFCWRKLGYLEARSGTYLLDGSGNLRSGFKPLRKVRHSRFLHFQHKFDLCNMYNQFPWVGDPYEKEFYKHRKAVRIENVKEDLSLGKVESRQKEKEEVILNILNKPLLIDYNL